MALSPKARVSESCYRKYLIKTSTTPATYLEGETFVMSRVRNNQVKALWETNWGKKQ